MFSVQQIQYLLAIRETGNFSRAAERCFVTQPTLSMQVKKAEETIGFPLIDRNRNPICLTVFGEQLVPHFLEIQSQFQELENIKLKNQGNYVEEIRLGIIPTVAPYLIPRLYKEWQASFPSIQLIIEERKTEILLQEVKDKKLDLGILAGPISEEELRQIPLFMEEILAYCNESETTFTSLDLLRVQKPWLLSKGNCLRTQMIQLCDLQSKDSESLEWNYEGGNIEMLIRMVDLNGGYTLIPSQYIPLLSKEKECFKHIHIDSNNTLPVRSIIGVGNARNSKWKNMEKLIRSIQHEFNKLEINNFQMLNWK